VAAVAAPVGTAVGAKATTVAAWPPLARALAAASAVPPV
jgi:hypothetical protein